MVSWVRAKQHASRRNFLKWKPRDRNQHFGRTYIQGLFITSRCSLSWYTFCSSVPFLVIHFYPIFFEGVAVNSLTLFRSWQYIYRQQIYTLFSTSLLPRYSDFIDALSYQFDYFKDTYKTTTWATHVGRQFNRLRVIDLPKLVIYGRGTEHIGFNFRARTMESYFKVKHRPFTD